MDGAYFSGPLEQTIDGLIANQNYTLSFDYAFAQQQGFSGATIQSLDAQIGNGFVGFTRTNTGDVNVADHGFSGWQTLKLNFTAEDTTEVLSFFAHGNLPVPPFALVSNVSIVATPEPGVWAMMIVGMGAMGVTLRRRKTALAAA
jgi:hypothetical protein